MSLKLGTICLAFGFLLFGFAPLASAFDVEQLTHDGINDQPSLNNGVVVWVGWVDSADEIMISNLRVPHPGIDTLTDNGGEKEHPTNVGSSRIVWQAREGGIDDWEIWVYDRYAIPRYRAHTDNEVDDRYPSVGAAGNFAWSSLGAIHYWTEHLHSESVISDVCCPTPDYTNTDDPPSYHDYEVVWRSRNNVEGGTAWILWNGAAGEIPLSIGSDADLYAGTVAYVGLVEGKRHIMYWDGEEIHQVTHGTSEGYSPSLYEGTIAFERWDGHDWEIDYWNGSEVLPVTDNDFNDTQPSLHGNLIAWVGRPPESADHIFYTAVPEPGVKASAGAALGALLMLRLRRGRQRHGLGDAAARRWYTI